MCNVNDFPQACDDQKKKKPLQDERSKFILKLKR